MDKIFFFSILFLNIFCYSQVFIPFSYYTSNRGPTISSIANRNVYEGNLTNIPFTIGHPNNYPLICSSVSLSATTSNSSAVPLSAITFVGTFPNCFLNINPPAGATGASNIVVTVTDTGIPALQASTSFTATVFNVQSLAVSPANQIIPSNSNFQFSAKASYSDGSSQDVSTAATWGLTYVSGTAPGGLTSSNGLVTVTTVTGNPVYYYTATYLSFADSSDITFNSSTITGFFTSPTSGNINVGGTTDIKCYGTTADGGTIDLTNNCTWSPTTDTVAYVNNFSNKGRVYGSSLGGPVTITATYGSSSDTTSITVDASPPSVVEEGIGLYARYYTTTSTGAAKDDPYGALVNARVDATVDFNWGAGANPAGGAEDFGGRWSGQITAPTSGSYCVQTRSDDGVRLWIGNTLVINNWTDHGPTNDNGTYVFIANLKTEIFAEFYENSGGAEMRIRYIAGACGTPTAVPRINLFPTATRALDIQQNVVPRWSGLRRGFTMNGTVGSISNGATITGFTNSAASPVDATASNANGTGMAYAANSERSQSIAFDGIDDSISVAASTVQTGTGVRTAAVWVNPTNIGAEQQVLAYGNNALNNAYGISLLSTGAIRVYGGGGSNCDTTTTVSFNTWTHIVTTYTGGTARIYINGALNTTCSSLSWNTSTGSTLYLGWGVAASGNRFSGYLDDVAFWNVALNAAETNTLYQKQKVFNP